MQKLITFLAFFLLASGARAESELLPVETFASLPVVTNVRLSPNGENVAFMVKVDTDDVQGVAIRVLNLASGEFTTPTYVQTKDFVIRALRWANDGQLLLSALFPAERYGVPTTESRLVAVDIETEEMRSVLPHSYLRRLDRMPQIQDDIVDFLRDDPDSILLQGRFDSSGGDSLIRASLVGKDVKRVKRSRPGVIEWVTDREHYPRISIVRDDTTYGVYHQRPGKSTWNDLWRFEAFSEEQVWPMSFDKDPDILYVRAYHDGRLAVFKVKLSDAELEKELVFSHPTYDVEGSLIYSKTGDVIGIRFSTGGGYTFWDEEYKALQTGLNKALPDTTNIIYDLSDDERRYVVVASSDKDPGTYYIGDRDEKRLMQLASRYPEMPIQSMVEKVAISYEARDGLLIEGYLTIPEGPDAGPRPAIIFPHGGPISYDDGGFDYWTQYFASRGYAVLQMNFRGSGGYGYDFMASGLQGWGLEMQNDVEDGTRWLIEEGIADPERICVVGASYGGYAALMEAARNPDLYQCAVSFAGVTDVAYLVKSHRSYTNYDVVKEQVGSDMRELRKRSPLHLAETIEIPVLMAHGTDDRSVRVRHSRKMHDELEDADKDVTYLEFENGDHYLSMQEHRIAFFKAMDAFLTEHL
jgi:dipeptidyl aminopeptidase/acylaminoacyl peptidase